MSCAGLYSHDFIVASTSFGLLLWKVSSGAWAVTCTYFHKRTSLQQTTHSVVEEHKADAVAVRAKMCTIRRLLHACCRACCAQDVNNEL